MLMHAKDLDLDAFPFPHLSPPKDTSFRLLRRPGRSRARLRTVPQHLRVRQWFLNGPC